jgi:hypothetical protein
MPHVQPDAAGVREEVEQVELGPAALGAESAGLLMRPDEFDAVEDYDDSFNYELIQRVLVVTPMASRLTC